MKRGLIPIVLFLFGLIDVSCTFKSKVSEAKVAQDTLIATFCDTVIEKSGTAKKLDSLGFVNIAEQDSSIAIKLMYATTNNFTSKLLYTDLHEAYLHPLAMEALKNAQRILKEEHPDLTLLVLDAARPISVQKQMWEVVAGTPKSIYVSNPSRGGGLHNYGMAVDITLQNIETGEELSMGVPFDHMGAESHITNESTLLKEGIISEEEFRNRLLLRTIMKRAGWHTLDSEWWHFNRISKSEAIAKYKLIP